MRRTTAWGWILYCLFFYLFIAYIAMTRRTKLDLLVVWAGLRVMILVNRMGVVGIWESPSAADIRKRETSMARMSWIVLILLICTVLLAGVPKDVLLILALWVLPRLPEALIMAAAGYWLCVIGRGLLRWARKQ
jgi:hypothetical protein